jgi:hypothetical protein
MAEISKQNLIVKGTNQCNEKWTQSSAVGGKKFVLTSKSKPCAKSQNLQDIPFDLKPLWARSEIMGSALKIIQSVE